MTMAVGARLILSHEYLEREPQASTSYWYLQDSNENRVGRRLRVLGNLLVSLA
jgi:hypothetical protein